MSDYLTLTDVTRRFGPTPAVDRFSLDIAEGESVVLLGPSGCGKTTCLRMIAGFERPDGGRITLDGKVLASEREFVPPEHRRMSVMFQNYALWPHMTAFDNVAYGPRTAKLGRAEVTTRVKRTLDLVDLGGLGERYPHQLSGGQQQRVAMARALATDPSLLLLDEPLSNLDTRLREEMRGQLKRLRRELKITMVYVTHDQAEALSLADRLVVMHAGRIEQIGTPEDVYRRPSSSYVAKALGTTNIVGAELIASDASGITIEVFNGRRLHLKDRTAPPQTSIGGAVNVSIRPSDIVLSQAQPGDPVVTVVESLFYGDSVQYEVRTRGGETLTVLGPGNELHPVGGVLAVTVDPAHVAVLDD